MWFDSFRAGFYATYISLYFFAPPWLSLNGIISTRIKRLVSRWNRVQTLCALVTLCREDLVICFVIHLLYVRMVWGFVEIRFMQRS